MIKTDCILFHYYGKMGGSRQIELIPCELIDNNAGFLKEYVLKIFILNLEWEEILILLNLVFLNMTGQMFMICRC